MKICGFEQCDFLFKTWGRPKFLSENFLALNEVLMQGKNSQDSHASRLRPRKHIVRKSSILRIFDQKFANISHNLIYFSKIIFYILPKILESSIACGERSPQHSSLHESWVRSFFDPGKLKPLE